MAALRSFLARVTRAVAAWGLAASAVVGGIGFVTDAILVRARGPVGAPWIAAGVTAAALGALLGIAAAPVLALIHAAARTLAASSELRRLARLPVLLAALAAGARIAHTHADASEPLRHPLAYEVIALGFAIGITIVSVLWSHARARWARGAALCIAALAVAFDVATPRSFYSDSHDLSAMLAAAAALAALRTRFEIVARAETRALLASFAIVLAGAALVGAAIEPLVPGWRAPALTHGHYVPRVARAFRLLVDLDGDGYSSIAWGGDCDDRDPTRNPDAHETTPGLDRNCNGIALPVHPTDADRGLAPAAGEADLPRGAVDRLILITVDCLRADAIRPDRTPRMEALAARGLRFSHAYAGGSQTIISLPLAHRGSDGAEPAAARLGRHGVSSTALLSFDMPGAIETAAGFAVVEAAPVVARRWSAAEVTDRALADLRLRHGPHYLWAHYFDAHAPYKAPLPSTPSRGAAIDAYDAEVSGVDHEIGRLLDAVEALDPGLARTAIVLTADHGEALGEHGVAFHAISAWEPIVRVPAILVAPGVVPGTYHGLVSHRDLPATVLGVFGLAAAEPDVEAFGRSWLRARKDPRPRLHRFVVSRSFRLLTLLRGPSIPLAAIVAGDLKLTKSFEDGLREMYDLRADPGETRNVEPVRRAEADALDRDLELYRDLDRYP